MKKVRRKRKKNHYFTKVHEEKILEYVDSQDLKIRTEIYVKFIQPAFSEMVDKIVYTYKFTNLPNIDALKDECKIHLTTILDKYDVNKGSKAFSYFSVITKNWFIQKVKKNTQRNMREVCYEDINKTTVNAKLVTHNTYHADRELREFWSHLWKEIAKWEQEKLKENEKKVIEAIKIILSESESIEIFNKKAIYLYLREITGLNTKQVINSLNKLRVRYRVFRKKWNEGDV